MNPDLQVEVTVLRALATYFASALHACASILSWFDLSVLVVFTGVIVVILEFWFIRLPKRILLQDNIRGVDNKN